MQRWAMQCWQLLVTVYRCSGQPSHALLMTATGSSVK